MSDGYQMTGAVAGASGVIIEIGCEDANVVLLVGKHRLALDADKRDEFARIFFKAERQAEASPQ